MQQVVSTRFEGHREIHNNTVLMLYNDFDHFVMFCEKIYEPPPNDRQVEALGRKAYRIGLSVAQPWRPQHLTHFPDLIQILRILSTSLRNGLLWQAKQRMWRVQV